MTAILSIQSHVAFGHVGNRAAVFPLERLGHEVIAVNTVDFSNHTGYGVWTGEVFSPAHVRAILAGVAERGALKQLDAVLSGYLGDVALGEVVLETVATARPAFYACDPVMGDVGRGFFVRPGLPEFIAQRALPLADLVTPNRFELEFLAGTEVRTLADALAATATIRSRGPKLVLVTSLDRKDGASDMIEMLVDTADGAWLVATPLLPFDPMPNGAGDAVCALFLSHFLRTRDAATALARAASGIYAIFEATKEKGQRELALIAAQDEFAATTPRFVAQKVR
ncbi:pyridoxal kinase PdxY [Roseiterribacter gracilis]|uniref:pyridoxal kinase n=1 Tax=Roseiterribacter gracilis TaxID=2812848 RepID=A0A8S8XJQ4_9PROT|nr:pyridoxal kinase PdxY [Rhodospirillales bacterium TMPK1]